MLEQANKRELALYAWLRHLTVLAGGALTVLVSLDTGKSSTGLAHIALQTTWVSLGFGILLASVRQYAEVLIARGVTRQLISQLSEPRDSEKRGEPISVLPPKWIIWSEKGCYAFLTLAVLSMVTFAVLR